MWANGAIGRVSVGETVGIDVSEDAKCRSEWQEDPRRLIRIDHVRVRASDPRNRADGLKIGRIPLTRHAAWSAKFEK